MYLRRSLLDKRLWLLFGYYLGCSFDLLVTFLETCTFYSVLIIANQNDIIIIIPLEISSIIHSSRLLIPRIARLKWKLLRILLFNKSQTFSDWITGVKQFRFCVISQYWWNLSTKTFLNQFRMFHVDRCNSVTHSICYKLYGIIHKERSSKIENFAPCSEIFRFFSNS